MKLFRIGSVFAARYEIRALLGLGPVGATYCATDRDAGGDVALKVLHAALFPTAAERRSFEAAVRKVGAQRHASLRRFYDVDVQGPLVFCTGAYYAAESLRQVLLRGMRYELYELEPLFWQLSAALEALGPMPHGGLRPENLLLLSGGLKLTDAGMATSLPAFAYNAALVKEGLGVYAAPEARDSAPNTRADVYSLAVIVAELLLGAPPKGELPAMVERRFGQAVGEVLRRGLSREPAPRHKTPASFFEALSGAIYTERPKETRKPADRPAELISDEEFIEIEESKAKKQARVEAEVKNQIPEVSRIETVILEPTEAHQKPEDNEATSIRLMGPFEEVPIDTHGRPVEHPSDDLFENDQKTK